MIGVCLKWVESHGAPGDDRYSVLSAPTSTGRLDALSEAVDTVTAMVEFQLSGE